MIETPQRVRLHPVEQLRPSLRALFAALGRLTGMKPLLLIGAGLVLIDLAFIAIQIGVDATDYGFNGAYRLSLETEMGVAQFYGWVKAGAAAFLLYKAWRRFHSPAAGLWAGALAYLGADDALRLHEKFGTFLAEEFGIGDFGSLRGQDVGELIAYTLILATAVTALLIAERRDRGSFPTMLTSVMVPVVGVFLFFAVVVDTVGGVLPHVLQIAVEDGGELLALSAIFLVAIIWTQQADELADLSRS
jgi:hypothetical protein